MQEKRLLQHARTLRSASTPFEVQIWRRLSHSRLGGHKFRRQHVIGSCIVEFFCPAKGLILEVDGDTHDAELDAVRDQRHARLGYPTMRFSNAEVGKNLTGVLESLLERLGQLPDRWPADEAVSHPGSALPSPPSPEGEGK